VRYNIYIYVCVCVCVCVVRRQSVNSYICDTNPSGTIQAEKRMSKCIYFTDEFIFRIVSVILIIRSGISLFINLVTDIGSVSETWFYLNYLICLPSPRNFSHLAKLRVIGSVRPL
jgi:hypothetical protein